jgi:hypothetical protein
MVAIIACSRETINFGAAMYELRDNGTLVQHNFETLYVRIDPCPTKEVSKQNIDHLRL